MYGSLSFGWFRALLLVAHAADLIFIAIVCWIYHCGNGCVRSLSDRAGLLQQSWIAHFFIVSPPQRWVSLVAEPVARSWIRPNISPSRLGPNSILVVQFEVTHFVSQIPQTHYGYSISSEQTSTREAMVLILGRAEWMHLMLCLASYIAMNRLCQSVGPRE